VYRVSHQHTAKGEFRTIHGAWEQWRKDRRAPVPDGGKSPQAAVIEVADSGVYEERLNFELEPGESVQLRAAPSVRPVLRLLDYRVDQPDPFRISGAAASRFVLEGFLVVGRGILIAGPGHVENDPPHSDAADEGEPGDEDATRDGARDRSQDHRELCDVAIRHCTLVPGWDLDCDCSPGRPDEPSLTLSYTRTKVVVEHSILGSIQVDGDERRGDPATLRISDSILDATSPDGLALSDGSGHIAYAAVRIVRTTVVGEVRTHAIHLAENSVFTSRVIVARRQIGCIRFSYVPIGSRTPRRYSCQPDLAAQQAEDDLRSASTGSVDPNTVGRARARAVDRVRPTFTSLRYGTPGYAQLGEATDSAIGRGADDESELGAFHDLYQPQRAANLWARLDEYTPAGMDAGIFYAS
jgi:hypothetical protein